MKEFTGTFKGKFKLTAKNEQEVYDILEEILAEYIEFDYIDIDVEDNDYPNEEKDRERYLEEKYANN